MADGIEGDGAASLANAQTATKRAVAAADGLREYTNLFELSSSPFVILERSGRIAKINLAATELLGLRRANVVGMPFALFVPRADTTLFLHHLLSCRCSGTRVETELRLKAGAGKLIYVRLSSSPMSGLVYNGTGVYRTRIVDLTVRKQAEDIRAETARQQKALYDVFLGYHKAQNFEDIYKAALEGLLRALACNRGAVLLCDHRHTMRFVSWRGLSQRCRHAVERHSPSKPGSKNLQPVCVPDVQLVDLSNSLKSAILEEGIRALAFIPLVSSGTLTGQLMICYETPHGFTDEELNLALTIAQQLAQVIDHRRAQEALAQKEAELESIVTKTPFMLTRCTRDLRYRYVSPAYAEMIGRRPEELAGRRIVEILGKKGLAAIRPYVDRVLKGETVTYEMLVPFKGTEPHFLHAAYVPDKDERGEVVGWFASIADISERKRAEERFRLAVEAAPSGMILVDQQRKITLLNSEVERLFGYTREELLGKSIALLIPERFRRLVANVPKRKTLGVGDDLFGLRKDGAEMPVEVGLNPIRMQGKRFVLASVVDISERKKAQEKIAANLRAVTLLHEVGEFCARPANSVHSCLQKILETAITIANADKGNLQILDQQSGVLQIAVQSGFDKPFLKFFRNVGTEDSSACAAAMKKAKYTIVEDITQSDIFVGQPSLDTLIAAGVRAVHSMPLTSTLGNLVGILSVHYAQPHRPRQREVGFMDLLARQAADYLERKNAEKVLIEVAQQQAALYELARRWQNATSLNDVYAAALDGITSALNCDRASILVYDNRQVMRFVAWRGLSATYRKAVEGHSPWKPGTKNPRPTYIADMRLADIGPLKTTIRREGIRAAAFIPLVIDGKLAGKFMVYHRVPHVFSKAELDLAMAIARQLGQAIQHAQDEDALRESEARMRATVEQATAGVARCDMNGRLVFANRRLCQMLGYSESELIGKTIADVTAPEDSAGNVALFRRLIQDGKPFEMEKRYVRKNGSILWGHVSVSPVRDADGRITSAVAVAVDVTARKQAETDLQRANELLEQRVRERTQELHKTNKHLQSEIERRKGLEGEILSVSDREQQRLGQELHDGLCQHLTAVAFMTRSIALRLRDHRVVDAADIEKVAELVNKAAVDTRNLSRALHRVDVDAAALIVALQDLADREIWRTPCRLEAKPSFRVDDDAAAAHLYRIAREAVINANKHAHAREIVLRLERVRQEMVLRVIDDGIGLPKQLKPQQGLGFHIMNYRAQLMGGRLEIDSPATGGTRVSCYLPLHATQSKKAPNADRLDAAMPTNSAVPVNGDLTLRHLARRGAANA